METVYAIQKYFLFVILFIVLLTNFTSAQWFEKTNGLPPTWAAEVIDACDSLTAIGPIGPFYDDSLHLTSDGCESWYPIPLLSWISDISIIDTNKIWYIVSTGEIYATKDGGVNWQLQYYDPSSTNYMNYIEMFDSLNGIAMGDAPPGNPALFLRTTDGGNNWISMNDSSLFNLASGDQWRRIDFVNIDTGYFFSWNESPEKLYKTTNGGKNWKVIFDTVGCQVLKFYDENLGIIKGGECTGGICTSGIHRTTDGGTSWELFAAENWDWGTDVEFIPNMPSKVWAVTRCGVYLSTNMGENWSEQIYKPNLNFRDIVFTDENHGWLLAWDNVPGGDCHIYYTNNGGLGGIVSVDEKQPSGNLDDYHLYQNYPNPFNPITMINYQIPERGFVTLKIYDVLGNEVATLVNEEKPTGDHSVEFNALDLPSGVYIYRLISGNFTASKKLILLR